MRLCNDGHSYATVENAVAALVKDLRKVNRTLDDTRWLVAVSGDGRFVPVVIPNERETTTFIPLAMVGKISVVR